MARVQRERRRGPALPEGVLQQADHAGVVQGRHGGHEAAGRVKQGIQGPEAILRQRPAAACSRRGQLPRALTPKDSQGRRRLIYRRL